MAALEYWLWLSSAAVSPRAKTALVERYGDAEAAFFAPDGSFRGIGGVSAKEAVLLERRDLSGTKEIADACRRQELRVLTLQDAAYPRRLKNIPAPPVVLYVKGNLPQLDVSAPIAVIGTRQASVYGRKMGRKLAWEIVRCGGIVVSGLTSGIDAEAARGALQAGGICVGVLGTAHEQERGALARDVAARGALISEYPPGMQTQRSFFRERNRIAAGISVGVLAVEAPERSGTRLFADEANEQGKTIFAVPGNADAANSACTLSLLKEGATIATCGWDVMSEFEGLYPGLHPAEQAPDADTPVEVSVSTEKSVDKEERRGYIDLKEQLSGLTAEQLQIVTAIDKDTVHVDDIIERTGLPTAKVLTQLTMLQIRGYIRRESGMRIALNILKK